MAYLLERKQPPIARILSGALAVYAGQQQGKLQRQERERAEAEMARRARLQEQDQALQMFGAAAGQEAGAQRDAAAGLRDLIPLVEPESQAGLLQEYQGMLGRRGPAQQQFSEWIGSQLPGGASRPSPNQAAPTGPQGASAAIPGRAPLKFKNPREEAERQSVLGGITELKRLTEDNDTLTALQDLEESVIAKRISIEEAKAARNTIGATLKRKGAGRESLMRAKEAANGIEAMIRLGQIPPEGLRQAKQFISSLNSATPENAEAALSAYNTAFPDLPVQESASERNAKLNNDRIISENEKKAQATRATGEWAKIDGALQAAARAKNPKLLGEAIGRQLDFLEKNPDFDGVPFEGGRIDPRPRSVTRMVPNPNATVEEMWASAEGNGAEVGVVAVEETETPQEARARVADELGDYFLGTDPKQALEMKRRAISDLWGIAKDPKATEGARSDALRRIAGIAEGIPELEGIYPKNLKLEAFTPWQRRQIQRDVILDKERANDRVRKAKAFDARMQREERQLTKLNQEIARGGSRLSDLDKEAFRGLAVERKEALATLRELQKIKPMDRAADHDALVAEAEGALKETESQLQQALSSGDPVGPIAERAAKENAVATIAKAQARAKQRGLPPLTQAQINALSRASRGQ